MQTGSCTCNIFSNIHYSVWHSAVQPRGPVSHHLPASHQGAVWTQQVWLFQAVNYEGASAPLAGGQVSSPGLLPAVHMTPADGVAPGTNPFSLQGVSPGGLRQCLTMEPAVSFWSSGATAVFHTLAQSMDCSGFPKPLLINQESFKKGYIPSFPSIHTTASKLWLSPLPDIYLLEFMNFYFSKIMIYTHWHQY